MLFIGDSNNRELSEKVADGLGLKAHYPEIHKFADGEIRVRILENVADKKIFVLKSVCSPVDQNLLEFLFTIDALKRNGANIVYGSVTYLGYSRADHMFRQGEGVPLEVVIKCIEVNGLNEIMLIDPHSIKISEMFKIPVHNKTALSIFAKKIQEIEPDKDKITLVSPDMGGIRRIKILSELLDNAEYAVINKERDLETGRIKIVEIEGKLNENCFIVDDMISGGDTMAEAICEIERRGINNIYAMATHAIFAGNAVNLMKKSTAKKVFVTDTINIPVNKKFEKLEILSVSPVIISGFKNR